MKKLVAIVLVALFMVVPATQAQETGIREGVVCDVYSTPNLDVSPEGGILMGIQGLVYNETGTVVYTVPEGVRLLDVSADTNSVLTYQSDEALISRIDVETGNVLSSHQLNAVSGIVEAQFSEHSDAYFISSYYPHTEIFSIDGELLETIPYASWNWIGEGNVLHVGQVIVHDAGYDMSYYGLDWQTGEEFDLHELQGRYDSEYETYYRIGNPTYGIYSLNTFTHSSSIGSNEVFYYHIDEIGIVHVGSFPCISAPFLFRAVAIGPGGIYLGYVGTYETQETYQAVYRFSESGEWTEILELS